MTRLGFSRIGVFLVLAVLLLLTTAGVAGAWTAANLQPVLCAEDQFYNYDFTAKTVSATGVDWPVTIVFCGNASVSKIKSAFKTRGWSNPFVNTMYGYENDGSGFVFAADGGVKTFATKSPPHASLRAGGQAVQQHLGLLRHRHDAHDYAELASPPTQWFGMSEDAATAATQTAIKAWGSKSVTLNSIPVGNAQYGEVTGANGERHIWQCDGMATLIRVP